MAIDDTVLNYFSMKDIAGTIDEKLNRVSDGYIGVVGLFL